VSEVFAAYKPKVLKIGKPHPGKIVETSGACTVEWWGGGDG
jgi:hypothetical protein